jgi:imidazole glycerol phosphate synthase glutamine amidotransferase subunit
MIVAHSAPLVEVLHYGGGNMGSLLRCLERAGIPYTVLKGHVDGSFPSGKHPILLPGVGAFGSLMQGLEARGFIPYLKELVHPEGVPFLGICVGLQVLFESSEESPDCLGLGILKGQVRRFASDFERAKVPQIGWNFIHARQPQAPEGFVYYVNSYYALPEDPSAILYQSDYQNTAFCGAVRQGKITAFQFHPEKSGAFGQRLVSQWYQTLQQEASLCSPLPPL